MQDSLVDIRIKEFFRGSKLRCLKRGSRFLCLMRIKKSAPHAGRFLNSSARLD